MGNDVAKEKFDIKSKKNIEKLKKYTNLNEQEILEWYALFVEECSRTRKSPTCGTKADDGEATMNKDQFTSYYSRLRGIDQNRMKSLAKEIFRVFDVDNNKMLTFQEFIVGYILTSERDIGSKMDYLFELYDLNDDNLVKKNELESILEKMVVFLYIDKEKDQVKKLVETVFDNLDKNGDNAIDRHEFSKGLLNDPSIRFYLSPFEEKK